jgi:hypothetical protein
MIIKIQRALFPANGPCLVYNESRSLTFQHALVPELQEALGDRPKAYFEAKVVKGKISILHQVEDQTW